MIPEYNLAPIKKGDTYEVKFAFYEDECETTPIDVSAYDFTLQAKDGSTLILDWQNADFVQVLYNYERVVTLTNADTALLTAGEFRYELQVDSGSGVYTYMQGYVKITDQIAS